CAGCHTPSNPDDLHIYRCKTCFGDELLCTDCMVGGHLRGPLHMIERWNGKFFEASSLKALGLRVQLGHPPGERCSEPYALHTDFVVLHTNRIHIVTVDACDCERHAYAGSFEEQLQRAGWCPATDDKPRTCATNEVLDNFLLQTYQAKTTMYDFYSVLEKLTNNAGVKLPNRYQAFLRMVREYSHLLMLKRAGRGHAKSGVMGTAQGELAVHCPCCPHPGVNLPDDWENALPQNKFLYIIFLAIDACLRLKHRLVSSERKDPSLGPGWSYMVETAPYREYLLTVTDQKEMSTCSGLAALDYANTKFSRGYSATGVGMGVCARHEFVQPNGVRDLQKGERYANMDWIFARILLHLHLWLLRIISYDIVCQWAKRLKERLKAVLKGLLIHSQLSAILALCAFAIPKMHIKGHLGPCQEDYSLNLIPGSGQTDGEGIERPWAHIGVVGTSPREMGPGSREDTLNGHWGSWNWQKIVGLGERLRTKADRVNKEYAEQMQGSTEFSVQPKERVPAWREMVEKYERDPIKEKNPYSTPMRGITEKEVLLRLEKEEAERVVAGVPGIHSVSPSSFVTAGLEVEEEQRRVRVQVELKKAGTTAQEIDVPALRRGLNRSIQRLHNLQATYTPVALVALGKRKDPPEQEQAEHVPLYLPSALTSIPSIKMLADIENALRDAQCSTALVKLRNKLPVKSRLLTYKALQAQHQGANTWAQGIVQRNECKIRLHSEKYQMVWEARLRLADGVVTKVGWQALRKEDRRCMEDAEELASTAKKRTEQEERRRQREDNLRRDGELPPLTEEEEARRARGGESVRMVSWIWRVGGTTGTDADLDKALRVEWSKAYARVKRWGEEVRLVQEEVRRAGVTLEFRTREWVQRAKNVPVGVEEWKEWGKEVPGVPWSFERAKGTVAYTLKQAARLRDIASRITVSMTEERRGRGRKRRMVRDDEWVDANGEDDEMLGEEEEEELEDLRGDEVFDNDFILGGGVDED
ncbi:hypothetical protein K438DRAFT_1634899, partial [Mycena galopus ATCC 62051]